MSPDYGQEGVDHRTARVVQAKHRAGWLSGREGCSVTLACVASYLNTMVRITDPDRARSFYEALGFRFSRDMDIVRDGELEATNYFYSLATTRTCSS
jgi:hypothetical protein